MAQTDKICTLSLKSLRHNVRNYTFAYVLTIFFYSMFWSGYSVIISSIEKRYSLSSAQSGFIGSAAEIGRIPMLLFVSHFGNRVRIPRLVAFSGICIALSQFIMVLPHFVFSGVDEAARRNNSEHVCVLAANNYSERIDGTHSHLNVVASSSNSAYAMIIVGIVLMGMSASPMSNIAISYIDNNADESSSLLYLSIVAAGWAIGPTVGSFLGAYYMTLYVDLSDTTLTPKDPSWIGAWWLMILTCSVTVFLTSPLLACFPRRIRPLVKKEVNVEQSDEFKLKEKTLDVTSSENQKVEIKNAEMYSIKALPLAIWRLLKNPILMTTQLARTAEDLARYGFLTYFPKYMEVVFYQTTYMASIFSGLGGLIGFVFYMFSGSILKKVKLSFENAVKLGLVATLLASILKFGLMGIGCETTIVYGQDISKTESLEVMECSSHCSCSLEFYSPVCDVDRGTTFFSFCHAGCASKPEILNSLAENFSTCNCTNGRSIRRGSCDDCGNLHLVAFIVIFFISEVAGNLAFAPSLAVSMRCVAVKDKALSMGVSVFVVALLGWMPCAVIYGKVIDYACSLWQMNSGQRGACWLYDIRVLRLSLHGLSGGLYTAAVLLRLAAWYYTRKKKFTWFSASQ